MAQGNPEFGATPPPSGDAYSTAVVALTPTSYWKLDESSGNFADTMPANVTGTAVGAITYGQSTSAITGPSSAIHFAGATSSRINYGNVYPEPAGTKFTVVALVFLHANLSGHNAIMCHGWNGGTATWQFGLNASRQLELILIGPGSVAGTSIAALSTGAWHHIAIACNGGVPTASYSFFIDGTLDTTITSSTALSADVANTYLAVANFSGGSFIQPLESTVDICGVAIWDGTQLSGPNIATLATAAGV